MALNLNTSPYFDDFDPDKGFNRVLFRPGVAVQARELTQLQTILQDQITNLASWTFREGGVISGCSQNTFKLPFIKLEGASTISGLSNYIDDIIIGQDTGIRARVVAVQTGGGINPEPNLNTFYLEYLDMGGETNSTYSTGTLGLTESLNHFYRGEILQVETTNYRGATSVNAGDAFTVNNYGSSDETYYGHARKMFVSPGIIYARGHFVRTEEISAILSRYGPGNTKRVIGFNVQETVVQSGEDNTLLDPASGSYNYNAPGADRLKFVVSLEVYDQDSADIPENFFSYAILDEDNELEYAEVIKDDLNELREVLRRRTYDESGNYAIHGLYLNVQEHADDGENGGLYVPATHPDYVPGTLAGDDTKVAVTIGNGKAYVGGNEIEINSTIKHTISKATETLNDRNVDVTMSTGNYIVGHTLTGDMEPNLFTNVVLRKTNKSGDVVGTAKLKHIKQHSTGTSGSATNNQYRFYLYDVKITDGNKELVRAITREGSTSDGALITPDFTEEPSNLTISTNTVTATFSFPHGLSNGDEIEVRKAFPLEYNGTYTIQNASSTAFDYLVTNAPSVTATKLGVVKNNQGGLFKEPEFAKAVWKAPYDYLDHVGDITAVNDQVDVEYVISGSDTLGLSGIGIASTVSFSTSNGEVFESSYTDDQIRNDLLMVVETGPVIVDFGGVPTTFAANDIVDLTSNHVNISTSSGNTQIDIEFTNVTGSGNVKLYANVRKENATPIAKTSNERRVVVIDAENHPAGHCGQPSITFGQTTYSLGVADIYRLRSIKAYRDDGAGNIDAVTEIDVTKDFIFDNGQRDSIYKHATIKNSEYSPFATSTNGYRYIAIEFDYFSHGAGSYSFFTFNSYPAHSVLPLQWIPTYETTGGQEISLRDAIDFRPVITNTATPGTVSSTIAAAAQAVLTAGTDNPSSAESYAGTLTFPVPDSLFTADFEWYTPKAVAISMNSNGRINILENTGTLANSVPVTPDGEMLLGTFFMSPFPSLTAQPAKLAGRPDLRIVLRLVDNRRYTMKDLRAMDQRISNLEYYVSLNALEKEAEAMFIPDGDGLNRFKNGILVDPFNNYAVAGVASPEFRASIDDKDSMTANPLIRKDNLILDYQETGSTTVKWGATPAEGFVSAPYSVVEYIAQVQASKTRNCVGELLFDYLGKMALYPSVDNFVEDQTQTLNPVFDNSAYEDAVGDLEDGDIVWGDWETTNVKVERSRINEWGWWFVNGRWVRRKITTTTTTTEDQERTGTQYKINEVIDTDTVTRVNLSYATMMRRRSIQLIIRHLKPNTEVFLLVSTSDEITGITGSVDDQSQNAWFLSGSSWNAGRRRHFTDSDGALNGTYTVPANRYYADSRLTLKISDDKFGRREFETTYASGTYEQSALLNQTTYQEHITRSAIVQTETITDERSLVDTQTEIRFAHDPIAQSFRIEDKALGAKAGATIASIDVWFKDKPLSGSNGVTVEIRNMVNGYPGTEILGSATKNRNTINVTPQASDGTFTFANYHTRFEYDKPIYLRDGAEYCFVVMPHNNDRNYNIWVGELGGFKVNTGGNVRISEQPHSGILFTSANNTTWNAVQGEDIMFRINRCKFTVGTHVANFEVSNSDYIRFEQVATNDPSGVFWDAFDTFPPFPRQTVYTEINAIDPTFGTPKEGKVFSLCVDISGTSAGGYTDSDTFTVTGGGGTGATFELITSNGDPVFVKCTDSGTGYTSAPTVTYNGSGTGATFTPRWNSGTPLITYSLTKGRVNGLGRSYGVFDITDGYFTQNRIRVPSVTGAFREGEMIRGSQSGVTARIINIDPNGYLRLASVTGNWTVDAAGTVDTITGENSGATGAIASDFVEYTDIVSNYVTAGHPLYQYHRTAKIASIDDRPYHEMSTNAHAIIRPDTEVNISALTTDINAAAPNTTVFEKMPWNSLRPFETKKNVYSYSNRVRKGSTNGWNTTPDLKYVADVITTNEFVSPIFDLQSFDAMVLLNVFNDDSTNETQPYGGNAKAKYVSKTVVLAEGQDAEDLNVFLSAYDPPGTSIEAYAHFLSADDQDKIEDTNWLKLELVDEPAEKLTGVLREYKYQIPRLEFTGTNTEEGYDVVNQVYRKTEGTITGLTAAGVSTGTNLTDNEIIVSGGSGGGARILIDTDVVGAATNIRVIEGGRGYSTTDTLTFTQEGGHTGLTFTDTLGLRDYRTYKRYAIKFVMLAPEDGVYFPNLHDYRAIALQT